MRAVVIARFSQPLEILAVFGRLVFVKHRLECAEVGFKNGYLCVVRGQLVLYKLGAVVIYLVFAVDGFRDEIYRGEHHHEDERYQRELKVGHHLAARHRHSARGVVVLIYIWLVFFHFALFPHFL